MMAHLVVSLASPDGINSSYSYDNASRLVSWNAGTIAGRVITYDEAGRRIRDDITYGEIPKPTLQRTALNTFDAADRIVSSSVRYGQGTNSTDHILETFTYDGNGAMTNWISDGMSLSLAYDEQGRFANGPCAYDALDNRIRTADGKYWIPNHADPLKRPLMEVDASTGAIIRYYIWSDNRLLGFIDGASGALTVVHSDDFASVIALTDVSGNVLYSANYGPHGEDWGSTGTNPTPFTWLGGYGVQTINSDTPLRLYLTRHRVYSATLNRFLSSDPSGISGGLNLYAYGEGNPLAYIDPLGLCASIWDGVLNVAGDVLTRIGGGLQTLWGTVEVGVGITFGTVTSTTVVGGIAGAGIATLGVDNIQAGARTLWTGTSTDTMLSQGLQGLGMSQGLANLTVFGIDLFGGGGAMVGNANMARSTAAFESLTISAPVVDANKLNHIFGNTGHGLDTLVRQSGSQEAAYVALQRATEATVKAQNIKGVFETTVKVGAETITVRGNVVDGAVKIGTAFK